MVSGSGGLNIKDYPFAFSIAVLLFPDVLNDQNVTSFLAITLVGGMLGSLLTIINPVGLLIRALYLRYDHLVFPELRLIHFFVHRIITKNFRASLSAPTITYEVDKMVGILYFLAILGLALYRLTSFDFQKVLGLDSLESSGMIIGIILGIIGVVLVLYNHVWGGSFHSSKSVTHLDRIRSVTALNIGVDFSNLCNEGERWKLYRTENPHLINAVTEEFYSLENFDIKSYPDFCKTFKISKIRNAYQENNVSWQDERNSKYLFEAYKSLREICLRYGLTPKQGIAWFSDNLFIKPNIFDAPIPLLQSSIDSRDWYNAVLKTYKITDMLANFLPKKRWLSMHGE